MPSPRRIGLRQSSFAGALGARHRHAAARPAGGKVDEINDERDRLGETSKIVRNFITQVTA
jgi:hypothetical protein